ncbi:MAG: diaminopimelate dehydrogenase [Peptoniphilus sp.]|nr:diaminopimelate dehydrogenase [Peptoniphilus sp.]
MINIGIVGYGNLGKSCEALVNDTSDMKLVGIFSRRDIKKDKFYKLDRILDFKDEIDVLILCGSSDKDITVQGPNLIENFNTVDSFDTHKKVYEYHHLMDKKAREAGRLALISTGWDPGLFSIIRTYGEAILEKGQTYTFWGKGISQGHSAAVRNIDGISDASQYTVPKDAVVEKVRNNEDIAFSPEMAHIRQVYAVKEEGYDQENLEKRIKTIPNYFDKYETHVNFISKEELEKNHKGMPHGGRVIRNGKSPSGNHSTMEFSLDLENNPDFTAAIDVAYARAVYKMNKEKISGALTVLDVPPKYLINKDYEALLKENI